MLTTMPGFTNGSDSRATDIVSGDSLGLVDNTIVQALGGETPPSSSENRYFVYNEKGKILCDIDFEGTITSKYIYGNGKHVARIDGSTRYYYHCDPLGSPLFISKDYFIPQIVKQYKYKAFGERKYESGTYSNLHIFTGKEEDGMGLHYFGSRYYDKSIGRWLSIEPKSLPKDLNLANPQSFNLYTYSWNNPLSNIDMNGEMPGAAVVAIGATMNATVGAGISIAVDLLATSAIKGKNPSELVKSGEYTGKDAAVAGLTGAAAGILFSGIGSMTAPIIVKTVLGGVTGGGLTTASTLAKEGTLPTGSQAAVGVGGGLVGGFGAGVTAKIEKVLSGPVGTVLGGIVSGVTSSDVAQGAMRLITEREKEANPPTKKDNINIDFDFQEAEPFVPVNRQP